MESVLYKSLSSKGDTVDKLEARFEEGIWLGVESRTGEIRVGTPNRVFKSRTIRRRIQAESWNATAVKDNRHSKESGSWSTGTDRQRSCRSARSGPRRPRRSACRARVLSKEDDAQEAGFHRPRVHPRMLGVQQIEDESASEQPQQPLQAEDGRCSVCHP